jgi:hypothetical protein
MKYIISENKINDLIYKYIDEMYGNVLHAPVEEYGDFVGVTNFYIPSGDDDEDLVFGLYDSYWFERSIAHITFTNNSKEILRLQIKKEKYYKYMLEKSPVIRLDIYTQSNALTGYFGDLWRPIFKDWFYNNFNGKIKSSAKIKTVFTNEEMNEIYNSML